MNPLSEYIRKSVREENDLFWQRFPIYRIAMAIAQGAHFNQVDKLGKPYIEHPLRVAHTFLGNDYYMTVAVLHDVLEDSDYIREQLVEWGIPESLVQYVEILTRNPKDTYMEYIEKIGNYSLTTKVKIADLQDNLSPERRAGLTDSLYKRYTKALKYLQNLE